MPSRPEPPRPPPRRQPTEPGRSVSVDITPRQLRVVPGQSETAAVSIRYHGSVITELTLTIEGDAAAWSRIAPDVVNVYPDTEAQATLLFDPPRAPSTRAGLTQLTLQVYSSTDPTAATVLQRSVEIAPFDELVADAVGSTQLSGAREAALPIKVRNRGNRAVQVSVQANAMGAIDLLLSADSLRLDPGGEATVWVNITARQAAAAGSAKVHPFTVVVSSDRSPPVTIDGRLEQAGRAARGGSGGRRWILGLMGAGALALVGGLAVLGWGLLNPKPALPPDTLSPVQTTPAVVPTTDTAQVSNPPQTTAPPTDETTPPATTEPPTDVPSPSPYSPAGWELIDPGPFTEVPAVASWAEGRLDIVAPRLDGTVYHGWWEGGAFAGSDELETFFTDHKMAAVSWGFQHIDVLAIGREDKALYVKTYEAAAGGWQPWQLIDDTFQLTAGPGVSSWATGRLDVLARGPDGLLLHDWFQDFWNGWETWSQSQFVRAPAPVAWGSNQGVTNHIEIFADSRGNGPLLQQTYDEIGGTGIDWQPLDGMEFNTAPAAISWGPSQIQVFATAADNLLYQRGFDGASWNDWTLVSPADVGSGPSAAAWAAGRIDLFTLGPDGGIYHRWFQDGVWAP